MIGIFPTNGGGTKVTEMKSCKSHGKKATLRYFSTSFPSIGIMGFFPVNLLAFYFLIISFLQIKCSLLHDEVV